MVTRSTRSAGATPTAAAAVVPADRSVGTSSWVGGLEPTERSGGGTPHATGSHIEEYTCAVLPAEQDSEEQTRMKTTVVTPGPGTQSDVSFDKPVSVAVGRARRAIKAPQRLEVGDPEDLRFNRRRHGNARS